MVEFQFIDLISKLEQQIEKQDKLYELGIDSLELNSDLWWAVDLLFEAAFGKENAETISYWMYELEFGAKEGNEIGKTVTDLYKYITENGKS